MKNTLSISYVAAVSLTVMNWAAQVQANPEHREKTQSSLHVSTDSFDRSNEVTVAQANIDMRSCLIINRTWQSENGFDNFNGHFWRINHEIRNTCAVCLRVGAFEYVNGVRHVKHINTFADDVRIGSNGTTSFSAWMTNMQSFGNNVTTALVFEYAFENQCNG